MILVRQSVSAQQDQADQKPDLTLFTELSIPASRYPSTTNKAVFGLPAVFFGLALSLGLMGNAALASCTCDEQILGREYCDSYLAQCRRYVTRLEEVRKQANNYGWDVCNESSGSVYAAYASAYPGYGYTRKGWTTVSPGGCRRILTESMTDKDYYIRIERSDGSSVTRTEKSFCMWPPQSNGQTYEASSPTCRSWNVGNKSFQELPKGNGFITTVR